MALTVHELALRIGAELSHGSGDREISGCAGLEEAGPDEVAFVANPKYVARLGATAAGAVILAAEHAGQTPSGTAALTAADPYFAFREAAVALHGFRQQPEPGISESAHVDPSAEIGEGVAVEAFAWIGPRARIGPGTVVSPHCFVGADARVGAACVLYPNVVVYDRCELGDRVVLQAGCVVGQDGFGYATHAGAHHKIPHVGRAVIEDDVEMGANCAVDRATVGETRVGRGTKCSDLVAIGHGTRVGRHNLLVAQVGIAGTATTGDYVVMGGQVGVAGHLALGDGVQLAAQSGVGSTIREAGQYGGAPARPLSRTKRIWRELERLPELVKRLRALEKRLEGVEQRPPSGSSGGERPQG